MPIVLVVEDGSGDSDANAYIEAAYADTYHGNRLNSYWAALSADQKAASIIKATDYLDKRFIRRYRGDRMVFDQALGWPRIGAYDNDRYALMDVPRQIQKACAEYALRAAIYNVLAPDAMRMTPSQDMTSATPNGDQTDVIVGPVRSKTEKVGPLEESTTYDSLAQIANASVDGSRSEQSAVVDDWYIPQYPEADLIVEELLESSMSVSLERA